MILAGCLVPLFALCLPLLTFAYFRLLFMALRSFTFNYVFIYQSLTWLSLLLLSDYGEGSRWAGGGEDDRLKTRSLYSTSIGSYPR